MSPHATSAAIHRDVKKQAVGLRKSSFVLSMNRWAPNKTGRSSFDIDFRFCIGNAVRYRSVYIRWKVRITIFTLLFARTSALMGRHVSVAECQLIRLVHLNLFLRIPARRRNAPQFQQTVGCGSSASRLSSALALTTHRWSLCLHLDVLITIYWKHMCARHLLKEKTRVSN